MVRHILLIQFKENVQKAELEQVEKVFLDIPDKIRGVVSVEWGENSSPENLNKGFTHCVLMTFEDEVSRDQYLPHPQHEELKSVFLPCLKDIIVFDYHVL